jgi:hypothetical protein
MGVGAATGVSAGATIGAGGGAAAGKDGGGGVGAVIREPAPCVGPPPIGSPVPGSLTTCALAGKAINKLNISALALGTVTPQAWRCPLLQPFKDFVDFFIPKHLLHQLWVAAYRKTVQLPSNHLQIIKLPTSRQPG